MLKFSKEYIVEKSLVEKYVRHLEYLDIKRKKREEMRKLKKKEDENKSINDYDWEKLYQEGNLKLLKVKVLDLYLKEKSINVPKKMRKKGKIELITADIARAILSSGAENSNKEAGHDEVDDEDIEKDGEEEEDVDDLYDSEEDSEAEDDLVLGEIGDDSDEDREDDIEGSSMMSDDEIVATTCTTRSGRTATTWKRRSNDFY